MRFYSGFSFRLKWKYIKWFIVPIIAFLCLKLGIANFILPTYAYENSNTFYNIEVPNYKEQLQSKICGNTNAYDFINEIINSVDFSSSYYQLNIFPQNDTGTNFTLTFIDSSYINGSNDSYPYALWPKGRYVSGASIQYQLYLQSTYNSKGSFDLYFNNCPSNTDLTTLKQNIINYINNNTNFSFANANVGVFYGSNSSTTPSIVGKLNPYSINNNTSYTTDVWYYYSSFKYKYYSNFDYASSSNYYKSIHLVNENKTYVVGDTFDSYYDLYVKDLSNNNNFIGSKDRLSNIYVNFPSNKINDFNIDISFNTNINYISAYNYFQNLDFTDINCYGRVNHNDNYYTYEKFDYCTIEADGDFSVSSDNDLLDFSIYNLQIYNNNTEITNFSNYDKIFFSIHFLYDDYSLNSYVSNLELSFPYNIYYLDSQKGEIYDDFDLSVYFKMLVSNTGYSDNFANNVSVKYSGGTNLGEYFIYSQPYNLSTQETTQIYGYISNYWQNYSVKNSSNLGYMFYHQIDSLNSGLNIPKLDLIIMRDVVISIQNVSNNNFYYVDSNGSITNNSFIIDYSNGLASDFTNFGGLLPAGPLDSLLNIPFKYLNKTIISLNEACVPYQFNFVFDQPITLPCFDDYYEQVPTSVKVFTEIIPCAFLLIMYFKHLYKKVSRATSLESTENDEWGVL